MTCNHSVLAHCGSTNVAHWILCSLFFMYFKSILQGFFVCLVFVFLEPYLQHMKVPRLGVESELKLLSYTTTTATWNPSYCLLPAPQFTHGNAGSLTHWARPGIEPSSWWILVGFITTEHSNVGSKLLSATCTTVHSQQHWILNPLSETRDWTLILMDTGWVHYHWATMGTPHFSRLR